MRKNRSDHGMIDHRGIKPEELSPAKDIKKSGTMCSHRLENMQKESLKQLKKICQPPLRQSFDNSK